MIPTISGMKTRVGLDLDQYKNLIDVSERRLYLYGAINQIDEDEYSSISNTGFVVERILDYNREDRDLPVENRKPILLYINSPGGDVVEGFALVGTIECSKTPIYTVNIGQWSSMSFLIGITGKKRFTLPYTTFLLHDGSSFAFGSSSKVQDRVKFEEKFEKTIIKPHVLKHSKMNSEEYDRFSRVELYMIPDDAMQYGFVDKIVTDLDEII